MHESNESTGQICKCIITGSHVGNAWLKITLWDRADTLLLLHHWAFIYVFFKQSVCHPSEKTKTNKQYKWVTFVSFLCPPARSFITTMLGLATFSIRFTWGEVVRNVKDFILFAYYSHYSKKQWKHKD